MLGGPYLSWAEFGDLCDEITGVHATRLPLPKPVLFAAASLLDQIRRVRSLSYPLTRDAAEVMTTMVPTDDQPTLAELGMTLRPTRESVEDTLRWLAEAGHLPAKHAGRVCAQQ
jgi:hypothetical protein